MSKTECPTCGKDTFDSAGAMKVHHSKQHGESLPSGVEVVCDYCGDLTRTDACRAEKNERNFCDQSCYSKWQSENQVGEDHPLYQKITVECAWCGEEKAIFPSAYRPNGRHFCNPQHQANWRSENLTGEKHFLYKERVEVDCSWCGETIRLLESYPDRKWGPFCDSSCYGQWRAHNTRGEDNPLYQGGKNFDYGPNWDEQRTKALERDGYACVICNRSRQEQYDEWGYDLNVHHRVPRSEFVDENEVYDYEEGNKLTNLITTCQACHKPVESMPVQPYVDV